MALMHQLTRCRSPDVVTGSTSLEEVSAGGRTLLACIHLTLEGTHTAACAAVDRMRGVGHPRLGT